MPPKIFPPHRLKEEIKQLLKDGVSPEECVTRFPPPQGPSERTIYRYLAEVKKENTGVVPAATTTTQKVVAGPTPQQLIVVTARTPAPITFSVAGVDIKVDPLALLDAWRYCEDIKRIEPSIDDEFTLMLKIAAKNLWEHFSHREADKARVTVEMKTGEVDL